MAGTIWLTGARGFVGAHLVRGLERTGRRVRCLTLRGEAPDVASLVAESGVPDVFIHAGWANVFQPQAEEHLTANVAQGRHLIDSMYDLGLRTFLFIGSSSEYGDRQGPLTEDMPPTGPLNNYVQGKLAVAAHGLAEAVRRDRVFVHVRLYYTYGPGQTHNSLINQLFASACAGTPIGLSPCEQFRDYIHVTDAAEGIARLAGTGETGIVNLGSGGVVQLKAFVQRFWRELGADPSLLAFGAHAKPGHEPTQPHCFADLTKLGRLTSWRPTVSLDDGIRRTVAELRAHTPAAQSAP
jgi:nucleoside-diphosphate-sugar epimerase